MIHLQLVFGLYAATTLIALATAIFQYFYEKNKLYLFSILYWASILLSIGINALVTDENSPFFILTGCGTFINQMVLAHVIYHISDLRYKLKNFVIIFSILALADTILNILHAPFEVRCMFSVSGAVYPVLRAIFSALMHSKNKFSSAQILLMLFSFIMSIHYLDYPFVRKNPDFFMAGFVFALLLLHSISALIPMAINEFGLHVRNKNLEQEIQIRLNELRLADQQIWESNRLSTIGRFSGIVAHEINTPLSSISIASQSILNSINNSAIDINLIHKKTTQIKNSVAEISEMTSTLRTASGDQIGQETELIDIKDILHNIKRSIEDISTKTQLKIFNSTNNLNFYVKANNSELSLALRNLITFGTNFIKSAQTQNIDLTLTGNTSKVIIEIDFNNSISSEKAKNIIKNSQNINFGTALEHLDLDLFVAQSIIDKHHGVLRLDSLPQKISLELNLENQMKLNAQTQKESNHEKT